MKLFLYTVKLARPVNGEDGEKCNWFNVVASGAEQAAAALQAVHPEAVIDCVDVSILKNIIVQGVST